MPDLPLSKERSSAAETAALLKSWAESSDTPGLEKLQPKVLELAQAYLDLDARLSVAEAYIPSRDYEDYRGDADREVCR